LKIFGFSGSQKSPYDFSGLFEALASKEKVVLNPRILADSGSL